MPEGQVVPITIHLPSIYTSDWPQREPSSSDEFPVFPQGSRGKGGSTLVALNLEEPSQLIELAVSATWKIYGDSVTRNKEYPVPPNATALDIDHIVRMAQRRLRHLATWKPGGR